MVIKPQSSNCNSALITHSCSVFIMSESRKVDVGQSVCRLIQRFSPEQSDGFYCHAFTGLLHFHHVENVSLLPDPDGFLVCGWQNQRQMSSWERQILGKAVWVMCKDGCSGVEGCWMMSPMWQIWCILSGREDMRKMKTKRGSEGGESSWKRGDVREVCSLCLCQMIWVYFLVVWVTGLSVSQRETQLRVQGEETQSFTWDNGSTLWWYASFLMQPFLFLQYLCYPEGVTVFVTYSVKVAVLDQI